MRHDDGQHKQLPAANAIRGQSGTLVLLCAVCAGPCSCMHTSRRALSYSSYSPGWKAAMSGARAVASAPFWATPTLVGAGPVTKKVSHEPLSKSLTAKIGRLIQKFNVATRGKSSYFVRQCRSLYDAGVKPSRSGAAAVSCGEQRRRRERGTVRAAQGAVRQR